MTRFDQCESFQRQHRRCDATQLAACPRHEKKAAAADKPRDLRFGASKNQVWKKRLVKSTRISIQHFVDVVEGVEVEIVVGQ